MAGELKTAQLGVGILSADATGRAKVAASFFDAGTVNDKFADAGKIALAAPLSFGRFGDGSDGAALFDGILVVNGATEIVPNTYTMNRDCFYTTVVVSPGITLKTNGFKLFASTSITVDATGVVDNSGFAGDDGFLPGTAGAAGSLAGGSAGQAGGAAGAVGTAGLASANSAAALASQAAVPTANAGDSGAGGLGGGGGTAAAGGIAGNATVPGPTLGSVQNLSFIFTGEVRGVGGTAFVTGGAGGAGGGGGDAGGGAGGMGGGGGGIVLLASKSIVNNGDIFAKGGAGGVGGVGGGANGGGGGGGGGGGVVIYCCNAFTGVPPSVAGGALGAAAGGSTAGTAGTAGTVIALIV